MARDFDNDYGRERAEGLGGLVDGLTSGKLLGDTLNRVVDAGERMTRVQQSALSAIGVPSGAQFESVVTRIRSIFNRLEELEDDIDRLERRIAELESRGQAAAAASPSRPTTSPRRSASSKPRAKPAPARSRKTAK